MIDGQSFDASGWYFLTTEIIADVGVHKLRARPQVIVPLAAED